MRSEKSRALARRDSTSSIPRSAATAWTLTALRSSSVWPLSTPSRTAVLSGRASRSPMRPRSSTSTRSIDMPSAIAVAKRPSAVHSGTNGPSTSRSSAPIAGMFTADVTVPPFSAAATCSAAW